MWRDIKGLPIVADREESLKEFFLEKKTVELSFKMVAEIMTRLSKEMDENEIDKSYYFDHSLDEFIETLLFTGDKEQRKEMTLIRDFSLWICSISAAPPSSSSLTAACSVFFMARGEIEKACGFYMPLLSIAISHVEMKESYILAGKKGGRPKNPRKKEAIEIAKEKWEQADYLSIASVSTAVKHQLEKKYTDAPSLPTIKKWITAADIKPNK